MSGTLKEWVEIPVTLMRASWYFTRNFTIHEFNPKRQNKRATPE